MNPKDLSGSSKPNLSVLPLAPLLEVIAALTEGQQKYGPWNWRDESVSETIYADAAIRHLMQWIAGEDIDPDSGVHHFVKAIAGLLIVRDAMLHGCSIDNRGPKQELNVDGVRDQILAVLEKYSESSESSESSEFAITADDVGRKVVRRDGTLCTITNFDDSEEEYKVTVTGRMIETYHGVPWRVLSRR